MRETPEPRPDSGKRLAHVLLWLGLLPVLMSLIAYRTSSQHVESVAATLSTDRFIRELDDVRSAIQDAETGQRGFLLTGESRYLGPFNGAIAKLPQELADLNELAAQNGVSRREMVELQQAIHDKLQELEKTIELRRARDTKAALAEVATNRGERYMIRIRSLIKALDDEQSNTFQQRLKKQRASQLELDVVLGIGIALASLLVYLAHRFNVAYVQDRDRREQEIRALNDNLEERVTERTAELKARTGELEERSAELQRSNADLMQFAYVASHDLQEPLRMVGSYMGLLARRYQGKLDETADRYIEFAVDGAHRMQALIHDLLMYSRAGTQVLEKKPISSEQVLQIALKNLDVTVKDAHALVRYENLPVVEADEVKLTQVMQNLVGNGIKFRKPDISPEISVTARRSPGEWIFTIADNGIGFDSVYCDRIFEVFQRLHGVGAYPGNGIGLAICRRIVEQHGGRLWAESEPGRGSTFFFSLPAATDRHENQSDNRSVHKKNIPEPVAHA